MIEKKQKDQEEFTFKNFFIPLTAGKAIFWIIAIGLVVYCNVLFNGFVWDDKTYIINNPQIHKINLLYSFGNSLFNVAGQCRPISALYLSMLYTLFKDAPFFYHAIQILLHISCAMLLYILYCKFLSRWVSFFIASIFLVHPINVEAVTYISATLDPLFSLFGLIPLIMLTKKELSNKTIIISSFLLLISLFTKETGVFFIFLILFYSVLFARKKLKKLLFGTSAVFLIYILFRFFVVHVGFTPRPLIPISNLSLPERIMNIPSIIFFYLKTFFFPKNLAIDQQWIVRSIDFGSFYLPLFVNLLFFGILIFLGIFLYKHKEGLFKAYIFFFVWFILGLGIHLQIISLDFTVTERWFYFPMMGLLGMAGITIQSFAAKKKIPIKFASIMAVIILVVLGARTVVRNSNWFNAVTLYRHDLAINSNFNIENNFAAELLNLNKKEEAIAHFKRSVELFPHEGNLYNLGVLYAQTGNDQKAIEYFYKAFRSKNYYYTHQDKKHTFLTYEIFGWFLLHKGLYKEALEVINAGIKEYPGDPLLWEELAIGEYKLQNQDGAVSAINKAIQLNQKQEYVLVLSKIQSKESIDLAPFP
jgi:protein O-mannosyl-transferase